MYVHISCNPLNKNIEEYIMVDKLIGSLVVPLCFLLGLVRSGKILPPHDFVCSQDWKYCAASPVNPKNRPGNTCASASDCYVTNNFCIDGYCQGMPMGAKCHDSLECDVGLYCGSDICVKAQTKNQYCSRTIPCASYLLCINHRCVEYGSMETGSVIIAENSQQRYSVFACKSGYVVKSGNDSICSDGYRLVSDKICTNDQTFCLYNNANNRLLYNITCVCGCSMFHMGYCPPGTADEEYIKNFKGVVAFSKLNRQCHISYNRTDRTDIPLFCDLARADTQGDDAYLAFLELDNTTFVRIQDNNQSVRDKENVYYWHYNSGQSVQTFMTILAVTIIIISM